MLKVMRVLCCALLLLAFVGSVSSASAQVSTATMFGTITDTTGGAVFYPDSSAQIESIFDQINRELRTQYRLAYYPNPRGPADSYRRIDVTVTPSASAPSTSIHNGGQVVEDAPNAATTNAQVTAQAGISKTPPPVYSVRHRKSYYTGLP